MPPSSDDLPGRRPPARKERRAAERAERKRKPGKQPGSPGAAMRWERPDEVTGHFPQGDCACGADLADAADLGVARSYQQEDVPEPQPSRRYQHDLHKARCACGRVHVAARPAGVPDAPLSVGPRLSAMAVYLSVFQHVPVERAQSLIADLAGGVVSAGFVHSCLGKAAGLVADATRLIRTLIAAAPVAGFDETTLRSGPAGEKKYVHGAFTELYSAFWLGTRSLETMKEAGILPSFAGIAVSDRYQGYYSKTWQNLAGHQACAAHIIRDFQDCAETYPGAAWPEQAMRSLRGLIHAWQAAREQGLAAISDGDREPLETEFRRAVTVGLAAVSRVPRPEEPGQAAARPRAARVLQDPAGRRAPVHHRYQRLADEQHLRARRPPAEDPAEDLRPPDQRRRYPGQARHPRLHRHRPQARPRRLRNPAPAHDRKPLAAPITADLPVTTRSPTPPSPTVHRGECLPTLVRSLGITLLSLDPPRK